MKEKREIYRFLHVTPRRIFEQLDQYVGRLPVRVELQALSADDLVTILTQPRKAMIPEYQRLCALDQIQLDFTEGEDVAHNGFAHPGVILSGWRGGREGSPAVHATRSVGRGSFAPTTPHAQSL